MAFKGTYAIFKVKDYSQIKFKRQKMACVKILQDFPLNQAVRGLVAQA
jgi:hypothetical protein